MNTTYLPSRSRPQSLLNWYREALRAALFLPVRWQRVRASPATLAWLTLGAVLCTLAVERLYVQGDAAFNWRAVGGGWLSTALVAWVCYLLRPNNAYDPNPRVAPNAAALFCAVLALSQIITLASGALYLTFWRAGLYDQRIVGALGVWALWLLPVAWAVLSQLTVLLRGAARGLSARLTAVPVLLMATFLVFLLPPAQFWQARTPASAEAERAELDLTQELMEAQPLLLAARLDEFAPQRPGTVDMYAITFAPYSDEDVFRRESDMVSEVIAQRFDAAGRSLQLVNHVDTLEQWPWATPLNLQRAIQRVAEVMDRDEDILFLHLTSHGARDGQLAAEFWPMSVDSVTPEDLKTWLDEAGIRYRIVSISACFSGSWIAPLADSHSLIMTAADPDHTSYGCGRGSELTYFGRAVFHEQLRDQTFSFEQAHASAREVIKQREEEAGKDDGYSNPQIDVGAAIRPRLELLQTRLQRPEQQGAQQRAVH